MISHCCLQKTSLGACHSRPSLVWPRWPLQPHFLLPASSMRALSQPNQTAGCSPASVWVPLVFSSLYPSLRNACLFSCPLAKWPTYTSEGDTFSFMRSNHRTLYTFPLSSLFLKKQIFPHHTQDTSTYVRACTHTHIHALLWFSDRHVPHSRLLPVCTNCALHTCRMSSMNKN